MLSILNCETKQEDINAGPHLSYLVQPNLHGKRQRLPSLKVLWINIFSYSGPTEKETVSFRRLCKLFSKVLKPLPCWTSFPHPNYSSLKALFSRFSELSTSGSTNIPAMLFIENGVYEIEDEYHRIYKKEVNNVNINVPISIIGESREHCIVIGGFWMTGKKEDDINVHNLTLRESKGSGIFGWKGASIHLDNVRVENSGYSGVAVRCTTRNTMKNCNVSHSKRNGLYVGYFGSMTIGGNTTVHHNCTRGNSDHYGLDTSDPSSSIHLISPLTIEMISTNNGGGGNHGGQGPIKLVDKDGKVLQEVFDGVIVVEEQDY